MRGLLSPLAIAVAGALVFTPVARAERTKVADAVALGGPVFAGDRVVFGSDYQGQLHENVVEPNGNRRLVRVLGPVPPPVEPVAAEDGQYDFLRAKFQASPAIVATGVQHAAGWRDLAHVAEGRLDAGPLDGPFTDLTSCGHGWDRDFAVDGERVAFTRLDPSSCSLYSNAQIVVRDMGMGKETVIEKRAPVMAYGDASSMQLAGPFVAWIEADSVAGPQGAIVVHDLRTGAERRVPATDDFRLRADGAVVQLAPAGSASPDCLSLDLVGPGAADRRRLDDCALLGVLDLDGRRVAYVRGRPATKKRGSAGELVVADTDGSARPVPVVTWSGHRGVVASADLQGRRLTYAIAGCSRRSGGAIYVDELAGRPAQERVNCSARLTRRSLRLQKDGSFAYRFACPSGCSGEFELARRAGRRWIGEIGFSELDLDAPGGVQKWFLAKETQRVIRRSRSPVRFRFTGTIGGRGVNVRKVSFSFTVQR